MEHDEKPLPIDIRLLGALAEKVCITYFLVQLDIAPLCSLRIKQLSDLGNGAISNFVVPCFCQSSTL